MIAPPKAFGKKKKLTKSMVMAHQILKKRQEVNQGHHYFKHFEVAHGLKTWDDFEKKPDHVEMLKTAAAETLKPNSSGPLTAFTSSRVQY